jgi:hypothetical protein
MGANSTPIKTSPVAGGDGSGMSTNSKTSARIAKGGNLNSAHDTVLLGSCHFRYFPDDRAEVRFAPTCSAGRPHLASDFCPEYRTYSKKLSFHDHLSSKGTRGHRPPRTTPTWTSGKRSSRGRRDLATRESAEFPTGVKEVLTLLGKSRRPISNAVGARFTRGMATVFLGSKHRI